MSYSENVFIYLSNLSYLYIFSVLISLIAFVGLVYFTIANNVHKVKKYIVEKSKNEKVLRMYVTENGELF
jgi:hypothetical protein